MADLSDRAGRRWIEAFGDPAHLRAAGRACAAGPRAGRANEAEVDAILTPSQRVRLRQIALQSEGPAAFREPEVVEALGLTPGQRERIRAIEEELRRSARCARCRSGKTPEDAGKPAMERILAVLTADQARRWKEMAGEPIVGPLSPFPAPFRPQRDPKRTTR